VNAQTDTLRPTLKLDKSEIDLCITTTSEKQFILTVNLNLTSPLTRNDSLFVIELRIAFKKDLVRIDGNLTLGTFFQQFGTNMFARIDTIPGEYNIYRIEGVSMLNALQGNFPVVHLTGRYLRDDVECMPFILREIYLGEEFQRPYLQENTDTVTLCALPRNLPNRYIDVVLLDKPENDTLVLDYKEIRHLDFGVNISNKRYIEEFLIEFEYDEN